MPVPCQPCRAVPEARVKVILMGVFLPSLAGSAGSYNPGRASCRAWAHTATGSLSKKGKKGCHNASFHTSICHRTVAVPHRQQCSANVSTEKRPRQKATGTQENSTEIPARILLLQNAHCILLTTFTCLALQINGWKHNIFVTRSQKA